MLLILWKKLRIALHKPKYISQISSSSDFKSAGQSLVRKPANRVPISAAAISYACQPSDFKCVSHPHTCISASMVCDGIHDCTDHSDEFNCADTAPPLSNAVAAAPKYATDLKFKRWKKTPARSRRPTLPPQQYLHNFGSFWF